MNILMISMDYPPSPGGIAAHVKNLATTLAAMGNSVTVLTRLRGDLERESHENSVRILRMRLRFGAPFYGLQINRRVRKFLPAMAPDSIHIHGMMPLEWYRVPEVPLVYTNHTSGYLRRIQKGGFRRLTMLKRYFNKVDLFLAPSRELLEIPFPIRAAKRFIPNGVNGNMFHQDPQAKHEIRQRLKIPESATVAIVTRRLVDKNGVIHLARAAGLVDANDLHYIIIGDGPERQRVEEEFGRNCGERVHFLGNLPHDEIVRYYSAADFSVLPSLLEATSISGLEAMAASLPLVGTAVGGIPELIRDGENGYLCEAGNPEDLAAKISQLLTQDLETMGRRSREMIDRRFDWSRIAAETEQEYRRLLV